MTEQRRITCLITAFTETVFLLLAIIYTRIGEFASRPSFGSILYGVDLWRCHIVYTNEDLVCGWLEIYCRLNNWQPVDSSGFKLRTANQKVCRFAIRIPNWQLHVNLSWYVEKCIECMLEQRRITFLITAYTDAVFLLLPIFYTQTVEFASRPSFGSKLYGADLWSCHIV